MARNIVAKISSASNAYIGSINGVDGEKKKRSENHRHVSIKAAWRSERKRGISAA